MEIGNIATLLSNNVFSIIMCILLWKSMLDQTKSHKEEMLSLAEKHSQENSVLTAAINNNTVALERLIERME